MNLKLAAVLLFVAADAHAQKFDRAAWQSDFKQLKSELEASYSHLAWFGSADSGVDLPSMDRAATTALKSATSDAEASAALTSFVAGFHDGHLVPTSFPETDAGVFVEPPLPSTYANAKTACAAWGYSPGRVPFAWPFESLSGFSLIADGWSEPFRSGVIEVDGVRLGVVRISRFRSGEFPTLCEGAWKVVEGRKVVPSRSTVGDEVDLEWMRVFAQRLRQLKDAKVAAVVVDLGFNGGGNDLGDWVPRLMTGRQLHSVPLLVTSGTAAAPYVETQLKALRPLLTAEPALAPASKTAVEGAITAFEARAAELRTSTCDLSWVWKEKRPWSTMPCKRLVDVGFFSGHVDWAAPGTLDPRAASALFWGSAADPMKGAWNGPVYVLTNGFTASSAEAFTTLLRDRGGAKVVGAHTLGAGCGFMNSRPPIVLPHARLAFNAPNCVRLRDDGTDDVAGVTPDLPVAQRPGESGRSVAARVLEVVKDDLKRSGL